MALARILVDGFSLLHSWTQLAADRARHSELARDELIRILTRYSDASGVPITIVFDGGGAPADAPSHQAASPVEVLYSRTGQTADQIIERVTHLMRPYGEVLVVTDDFAERETVASLGGMTSSCANFIDEIETAVGQVRRDLTSHNLRERNRFRLRGR